MCKEKISKNEYYLELEKCISCNMAETPTLKELLNHRKENHAALIIISTYKNDKNLFKGNISELPKELLNIPIFEWDKRAGIYITIE